MELKTLLKELQPGRQDDLAFDPSSKATQAIKLDLLHFMGDDPQRWIFQAEEYFAFHGIKEEA